jgi:hypothetical protein
VVEQSVNPTEGYYSTILSITETWLDLAVLLLSGNGRLQIQTVHSTSMGLGLGKSDFNLFLTCYRSRWEGTFPSSGEQGCPSGQGCSCTEANVTGPDYSEVYTLFLNNFFFAQVKI